MSIDLLHLDAAWIVFAGLMGAIFGSFLNVCILRWGAEPKQSVMRPRSRCPRCGRSLAWYDNIPVISWLLLRARCRGCGEPISIQYPLIELATAGIWAFMAWRHGISLETLHGAVFGTILLGITMTDAREYIIPHEFSLGGTVLAILLSAWPDPSYTLVAFQGALVGAGAVLLIGELSELVIGQEAMGGGDCALMGMIGAFLGWEAILPVLLLGALISTLLFLIIALWPHRGSSKEPRSERGVEGEPATLRWGMVARLFIIGVTPIILLALSVRVGVVGDVFSLISRALLGAGIAYYASFLLPASVAQRRWVRVRGLLAAAIAVALSAPLSGVRLALGLALGVAIVQYAKHVRPAQSPGTREELTAEGYLPFGVGLAVAAAVLDFSGALPLVRDVVLEYGRFLRLA